MPTVPQGVVLNHKLRCHRCPEAQREGCSGFQLLVGKIAHSRCSLATVLTQEFEGGGFGYCRLFGCVLAIDLGNGVPVTSVMAFPPAMACATCTSIGYILAT